MNAAYRLGLNNNRVGEVNQADDDSIRSPETISVAGAAQSLKGFHERRNRTSFADVSSSKASMHGGGVKRALRSPMKTNFQKEFLDYPENLSSHTVSVHQKSMRRGQSPFREAKPKARALASRLAQHYVETSHSVSNGVRERQSVRPSSPRKEPSSSRKPPFVPSLALGAPSQQPDNYHLTYKQASDGMDEFSQRVVDVSKYIDNEGEVDQDSDQEEDSDKGSKKLGIHGQQFNTQMKRT